MEEEITHVDFNKKIIVINIYTVFFFLEGDLLW